MTWTIIDLIALGLWFRTGYFGLRQESIKLFIEEREKNDVTIRKCYEPAIKLAEIIENLEIEEGKR